MRKRKKLKKKVVILIILIIVLALAVSGFIVYKTYFKSDDNKSKIIDEIPEYGYTLEADQPKIYKDLFKKLVSVLKEENVNEEEYARLISQMAAIDFYNLDNKVSKNDVGGVQFIRAKNAQNFVLEASETVYKYIEQDIYKKRDQKLPVVTKSEVKEITKEPYSYKNIKDDDAYKVIVNLEYKKDLGYPNEVEIKLLHTDKKLEIYSMK